MHELLILPEAYSDIEDAYLYYEEQLTGLGDRFMWELNQRLKDLEQHPTHYGYINEGINLKTHRDVLLHSFPYRIVYNIQENRVIICAVLHGMSNPARIVKRLKGRGAKRS